ncbi:hypothetical protein Patl1_01784 [Pistacia atlantica]|uniref:Uncharacterized protein n=1 Tax=Pistacia atlantica TaxID=434234 RepID=A0ACC1C5G5_9ROSI|nr:hypothetical protein Patl1_01784 [Pistacia atlantica]
MRLMEDQRFVTGEFVGDHGVGLQLKYVTQQGMVHACGLALLTLLKRRLELMIELLLLSGVI